MISNGSLVSSLSQLAEQERAGGEEVSERLRQASQRLREMERGLQAAKKEVAAYQDMLEQSQGQHIALEKKYRYADTQIYLGFYLNSICLKHLQRV